MVQCSLIPMFLPLNINDDSVQVKLATILGWDYTRVGGGYGWDYNRVWEMSLLILEPTLFF